jgi:hypothetical protein
MHLQNSKCRNYIFLLRTSDKGILVPREDKGRCTLWNGPTIAIKHINDCSGKLEGSGKKVRSDGFILTRQRGKHARSMSLAMPRNAVAIDGLGGCNFNWQTAGKFKSFQIKMSSLGQNLPTIHSQAVKQSGFVTDRLHL